jgi:hypothetical protein
MHTFACNTITIFIERYKATKKKKKKGAKKSLVTPSPQKKKKQLVVTPKKKKKVEKMVGKKVEKIPQGADKKVKMVEKIPQGADKKVEKEAGGHTRCSLKIVFAHASYVCLRV